MSSVRNFNFFSTIRDFYSTPKLIQRLKQLEIYPNWQSDNEAFEIMLVNHAKQLAPQLVNLNLIDTETVVHNNAIWKIDCSIGLSDCEKIKSLNYDTIEKLVEQKCEAIKNGNSALFQDQDDIFPYIIMDYFSVMDSVQESLGYEPEKKSRLFIQYYNLSEASINEMVNIYNSDVGYGPGTASCGRMKDFRSDKTQSELEILTLELDLIKIDLILNNIAVNRANLIKPNYPACMLQMDVPIEINLVNRPGM